jgi:hypothetical protein
VALGHLANLALEPTRATPLPCVCISGGSAHQLRARQAGRSYLHSVGNHLPASSLPPVARDVGGKHFFTTEEQLHLFHADERLFGRACNVGYPLDRRLRMIRLSPKDRGLALQIVGAMQRRPTSEVA